MKGLIKKDLLLLKNNWKSLIVLILVYMVCSTESDGIESFIIPFMMAMLCMSTFSYDEYNKWDAYAISLPEGRESVVKAKYLTATILLFLGVIAAFALSIAIGSARGKLDMTMSVETTLAGLASGTIVVSVMFPLIMKWGLEKGRILIMILSFGLAGAATVLLKLGVPSISLKFMNDYAYAILPMFAATLFAVSYIISKKIYLKKEF